jgi:hypothetical protein
MCIIYNILGIFKLSFPMVQMHDLDIKLVGYFKLSVVMA